jgi:hypothetical protein
MNLDTIVSELKNERDRLDRAIKVLEGSPNGVVRQSKPGPKPVSGRPDLTPQGRRRLSEIMKKKWAERRAKAKKNAKAT